MTYSEYNLHNILIPHITIKPNLTCKLNPKSQYLVNADKCASDEQTHCCNERSCREYQSPSSCGLPPGRVPRAALTSPPTFSVPTAADAPLTAQHRGNQSLCLDAGHHSLVTEITQYWPQHARPAVRSSDKTAICDGARALNGVLQTQQELPFLYHGRVTQLQVAEPGQDPRRVA